MLSHQGVSVVPGHDQDVDGRGVIGDADAAVRLVLLVVVGHDGRDGAAQDLEAAGVDLVVPPLLGLAVLHLAHERHADRHPDQLKRGQTSEAARLVKSSRLGPFMLVTRRPNVHFPVS